MDRFINDSRHITSRLDEVLDMIRQEVYSALEKHPRWFTDLHRQMTVVTEEHGELAKAIVQFTDEGGSAKAIEHEAIQLGAMAARMLCSMNFSLYVNAPDVRDNRISEGDEE